MTYETIITSDYMRSCRPWKSEQQHINEYLYRQGLPYSQQDMTNLHTGMRYVGPIAPPILTTQPDGSVSVQWDGTPGDKRDISYRRRPVKAAQPWGDAFSW